MAFDGVVKQAPHPDTTTSRAIIPAVPAARQLPQPGSRKQQTVSFKLTPVLRKTHFPRASIKANMDNQHSGSLSWRLSSHPITLLCFLGFRISSLLVYLFGLLFTNNFVLIFIITILLLASDFYYLKNIAGRRLVGLRWWNEADSASGDSHWVFESSDPNSRAHNATDGRFFWMALYAQPVCWVGLAVVAIVRFEFIWLSLVVIAMVLTITNTLAFSRYDKFSQASNLASSAIYSGGLARNIAGGVVSRFFNRG